MQEVAQRDVSVVLSSHVVSDLERVCDYLVILVDSHVHAAGDVETLLATHRRLTGPRRDIETLQRGRTWSQPVTRTGRPRWSFGPRSRSWIPPGRFPDWGWRTSSWPTWLRRIRPSEPPLWRCFDDLARLAADAAPDGCRSGRRFRHRRRDGADRPAVGGSGARQRQPVRPTYRHRPHAVLRRHRGRCACARHHRRLLGCAPRRPRSGDRDVPVDLDPVGAAQRVAGREDRDHEPGSRRRHGRDHPGGHLVVPARWTAPSVVPAARSLRT